MPRTDIAAGYVVVSPAPGRLASCASLRSCQTVGTIAGPPKPCRSVPLGRPGTAGEAGVRWQRVHRHLVERDVRTRHQVGGVRLGGALVLVVGTHGQLLLVGGGSSRVRSRPSRAQQAGGDEARHGEVGAAAVGQNDRDDHGFAAVGDVGRLPGFEDFGDADEWIGTAAHREFGFLLGQGVASGNRWVLGDFAGQCGCFTGCRARPGLPRGHPGRQGEDVSIPFLRDDAQGSLSVTVEHADAPAAIGKHPLNLWFPELHGGGGLPGEGLSSPLRLSPDGAFDGQLLRGGRL